MQPRISRGHRTISIEGRRRFWSELLTFDSCSTFLPSINECFLTPRSGNLLGPTGKVAYDTANHFPKFMFRSLESFDTPAVINKRIAYGNLFNWQVRKIELIKCSVDLVLDSPQGLDELPTHDGECDDKASRPSSLACRLVSWSSHSRITTAVIVLTDREHTYLLALNGHSGHIGNPILSP